MSIEAAVAPDGPHPGRPASIHCHPSRRDCSHPVADSLRPHAPSGPRRRLPHLSPPPARHFPALRRRWSAAASPRSPSELALRAIRHPDACERLSPLVVLVRMSVLLSLPGVSSRCWRSPCRAGVLLLVVLILYVLPLGIWRPIRKIPAVAENGDSNPTPACRRSLSGTHFAQERPGCAGGNGRGRCAPRAVRPEACGFLQAPLRLGGAEEPSRRKWMARLLTQTRRPMPPAPEGRLFVRPSAPRKRNCL